MTPQTNPLNLPSPISWPPSQSWEEADGGLWSSFALRIGSDAQVVNVLISTAGQATWVVSSLGCPPGSPASCTKSRGGLFNSNSSRSWTEQGNYSLGLELNLYASDNATYGLDTVALGFTNTTGTPPISNQIVAAITEYEYELGMFGLGPQPTNLTNFSDPHPSFLTTLYNQNLIPSLSWGYTAGAEYQQKQVLGSLTLGGYDAARFIPNNISFDLTPDISRDLVVGLQRIISEEANGSTHLLLPSPHLTFIDSTIPYIYLPQESCDLFARVYGLVWDDNYRRYLVDEDVHQALTMRSPNFVFTIGNSKTSGPTVEITLPYKSFDLTYKESFDSKAAIRYFPIQPALNDSQLTLGRTFLQEAYLVTDYEHANFSVSQCDFEPPLDRKIVPILPSDLKVVANPPNPSSNGTNHQHTGFHLDRPKVAGTSVGAVLGSLLLLAVCYWLYSVRRRRKSSKTMRITAASVSSAEQNQRPRGANNGLLVPVDPNANSQRVFNNLLGSDRYFIPEIATNSWNFLREVPDNNRMELPELSTTPRLLRSLRSATPDRRHTERPGNAHSQGSQRQPGLVLSSSDLFSARNIVRQWLNLDGLRISEAGSVTSIETSSTISRLKQSYLDRPLPPTPTAEVPQKTSSSAWTRLAAREHKGHDLDPTPAIPPEGSLQHRRGSF
ncbi:MAG: hypothetical protein Q9201_003827 [Fulgogasparrea decipioides]